MLNGILFSLFQNKVPPTCLNFFIVSVKAKVDTIKLSGMKVGKQAASKSGGLFSEEDWICSQ